MRQLPIMAAFLHTVRSTLNNLPFAIHISWPWMLVLLPINIVGNLYTSLNLPPPDADPMAMASPELALLNTAMLVCAFVVFASVAVSWHRYILADEVPQGAARLRLDSVVWRYVGNAVLIALITICAGFVCFLPVALFASLFAGAGPVGFVLLSPAVAIAIIAVLGVSLRLSVRLPAIAMGNEKISLTEAWNLTRENHWRIGTLFSMIMLSVLFAGFVLGSVLSVLVVSTSTLALIVLVVVQMAVNWISTIWNVTLLTSLYGFFVERRDF